jgi:peptidoglycan hydrolase-like protein with peptidoglycan-binding domain
MARYLNPPAPRTQPLQNSAGPVATIKPKRRSVRIESSRAIQIQQALASRGFYSGQMTGNYDEATIDAMRRFQASQKIAATGYPTAHALKRLGLANW